MSPATQCAAAQLSVPNDTPPLPLPHLPRLAGEDSERIQPALRREIGWRRQRQRILPLTVVNQPQLLEAAQGGEGRHGRQRQEGAFQLQPAQQGQLQNGRQGALWQVLRRQAQAAQAGELRQHGRCFRRQPLSVQVEGSEAGCQAWQGLQGVGWRGWVHLELQVSDYSGAQHAQQVGQAPCARCAVRAAAQHAGTIMHCQRCDQRGHPLQQGTLMPEPGLLAGPAE